MRGTIETITYTPSFTGLRRLHYTNYFIFLNFTLSWPVKKMRNIRSLRITWVRKNLLCLNNSTAIFIWRKIKQIFLVQEAPIFKSRFWGNNNYIITSIFLKIEVIDVDSLLWNVWTHWCIFFQYLVFSSKRFFKMFY